MGCSCIQAAERRANLEDSYYLHRFLSDYRDLISWIHDMKTIISADDLAKDVAGAESLLEKHQEHKVGSMMHNPDVLFGQCCMKLFTFNGFYRITLFVLWNEQDRNLPISWSSYVCWIIFVFIVKRQYKFVMMLFSEVFVWLSKTCIGLTVLILGCLLFCTVLANDLWLVIWVTCFYRVRLTPVKTAFVQRLRLVRSFWSLSIMQLRKWRKR